MAFHHIPCLECFYCQRKLYAQCTVYKKVGHHRRFRSGGRRLLHSTSGSWTGLWSAASRRSPRAFSFERATLVEPLNTCLKAVVQCDPQPGEFVAILGQGPIGLMFTMLVNRTGARIATTDTIAERRALSARCGAEFAWDPREVQLSSEVKRLTNGRGADLVIVAASVPGIVDQAIACSRPGARILLFAQTAATERIGSLWCRHLCR